MCRVESFQSLVYSDFTLSLKTSEQKAVDVIWDSDAAVALPQYAVGVRRSASE